MQHSLSSEVQSSSAIQEIPRTWWNLEVLYHAHKGPVLIHIIMQTNPVKTDSFFFMTHFNIILQSTHAISKCFFPPPPKKNSVCISPLHVTYMPLSFSLIWSAN